MHTEKREDPLVELGYEIRDLNTKAIRNAAIGFFTFAFGSGIIGFVIFRLMNPAGFTAEKAQHRLLPQEPNPIVQSNLAAKTDIMAIRQHERAVLESPVGWTDDTHTRLHIPIAMAMKVIADRGRLPGAPAPAAPAAPAITLSTASKPGLTAQMAGPNPQATGGPQAGAPATVSKPNTTGAGQLPVTKPAATIPATTKPATTKPATTPKKG